MASKGPKTGAPKPAVQKPVARVRKPVAPTKSVAAVEAEKPVPQAVVEQVAPPQPEPVPAPEAAPQEVIETVQTAVEQAEVAVAQTVNAAAAVEETVAPAITKDRVMETIETNVNKAQAMFADMNERTKAAVEKSTKFVEEANEFAKGNLEALVESGRIAAKGLESFGQEAAEYSRKSFENATAALKSLSAVKSPTEFFKLQSDYLRGAFDSYVAEASKHTEAMIKLAGDAAQPLSSRVAVAVEKAKVAA